MEVIKKYKTQILFHICLNLVIGIFITFSTYYYLPLVGLKDYFFYFVHFLLLQFSIFGFIYILSLNKIVFKTVFPILFFIYSFLSYWVYTQDITISHSLIQVALETKSDVVFGLLSYHVVIFSMLVIITIYFIIKFYDKIKISQLKSPLIILAIVSLFTYNFVENYRYGTFKRRLPYNTIFAVKEYLEKPELILKSAPISEIKTDSLTVIFVLGESVRADHLQLNGYNRMTTPLLQKTKNIISFPKTYTPNTYTSASVPQILTDANIIDDFKNEKYSLIDVLNKSKIKTYWIGNQTPEKSYEIFMEQSNFKLLLDPLHSEFNFQKRLDGELLPEIKKHIVSENNQFILVHMMGSHWFYENRYSHEFNHFKPNALSKNISSNTNEEMINSYDNTILYLDYFMNDLIQFADNLKRNILIIYLSDHGELLGENGQWLHAQEGEASKNPGMFIWYSEQFQIKYPDKILKLEENKNKTLILDFFYPSVLDLYNIEKKESDKSKSVFK